jgi:hypothetical protein
MSKSHSSSHETLRVTGMPCETPDVPLITWTGFGEYGHDPQWPNGARIAVSFVLNYEEGGERNPMDGDETSEAYLWEKGPSGGGREQRHLNGEQDYEYGSRCGAWRILRLMREFGWNMTLWAIAVAMERNPTFAKACVRDGHEIGAHGYRWLDIWDYSLEDDKAYIKKTCKALEAATGKSNISSMPYPSLTLRQGSSLLELTLAEGHQIRPVYCQSCGRKWDTRCCTLLKCIMKTRRIGLTCLGKRIFQQRRKKACSCCLTITTVSEEPQYISI